MCRTGMMMGIALATLVTLAGCAKDPKFDGQLSGVSGHEAQQLNAEHKQFEQGGDPPIQAQTHFLAGQLAENQGNLSGAIVQYERAVKLDGKYINALIRLGVLYAELKQYPQAIGAWNRYIKATNDSAEGYGDLGFCQELAGQAGEAEASYKRGIEIDPMNHRCRVNYGLMLARQGRANESLLQFQAVLTPADAHYNLGSVYEQQGKKDQARVEYQKAVELDPTLADAQKRLASLK